MIESRHTSVKVFFVSTLFVLLFSQAFACMNAYRTLLTGEVIFDGPTSGKVWNREIDKEEMMTQSKEIWAKYQSSDSLEYLSDYATTLVYLGQYEEAKHIYHNIELKRPGMYTTASNLGTLYELMANPDSALYWIRRSVAINPASHKGSEWIHIKILESKLRGNFMEQSSVLELDFGHADLPENIHGYDLEKLKNNIWHQLRERTLFVKPVDRIVGSIYFDLGNVLALTTDLEAALESYEAAEEYGFKSELMEKRKSKFEWMTLQASIQEKLTNVFRKYFIWVFAGGLLSFICFLVFLIIRMVKRKQRYVP